MDSQLINVKTPVLFNTDMKLKKKLILGLNYCCIVIFYWFNMLWKIIEELKNNKVQCSDLYMIFLKLVFKI